MNEPSGQQIRNGTFRMIDGAWHKRCTGPGHDEPTYLPANEKYFHVRKTGYYRESDNSNAHKKGDLLARCRLCINWHKLKSPGLSGYIPVRDVRPYYTEAVNRVGLVELAKRAGVSQGHVEDVIYMNRRSVQKGTFRKVLLQLISMRRKGESGLSAGARWRNERRSNGAAGTCSGCGGPKDNVTEACPQCINRKYKADLRLNATPEELEETRVRHNTRRTKRKLAAR